MDDHSNKMSQSSIVAVCVHIEQFVAATCRLVCPDLKYTSTLTSTFL